MTTYLAARGLAPTPRQLEQALERVGLYGYEDVPLARMSAGQKRRVGLARLFVEKCPLWILDEPFTGLDEENRRRAALCIAAAAETKPVLLVTHDRTELNLLRANIVNL